jgi:FMN reductase
MSAGPPVRILAVSASMRPGSTSRAALDLGIGVAHRLGCDVTRLDLRDLVLPLCNGDKQEPWPHYPAVKELREAFRAADGILLAGPEYHGSISGALKNAIDLLDFEHVEGKVFAAIVALGGRSNSNALNQLRLVARWLHAWMIPEQVAIPQARTATVNGQFRDPEVETRVEELVRSLVLAAARLSSPVEQEEPPDLVRLAI